jgi:hypothetical protein
MKRVHNSIKYILAALVSAILLSCTKNNGYYAVGAQRNAAAETPVIGAVLDSGILNSGLRKMQLNMSSLPYELYGADNQVTYVTASTNFTLFVNSDGTIPAGDYTYAAQSPNSPFTFGSGYLVVKQDSTNTNASLSYKIVNGKISISQNGSGYLVSLNINLSTGMTASEVYSGNLTYDDSK